MLMYKVEITNNNKYELELDRANVVVGSGGTVVPVWGTIIGDITQQKDLQEELTGIKESIPDLTQVIWNLLRLISLKFLMLQVWLLRKILKVGLQ